MKFEDIFPKFKERFGLALNTVITREEEDKLCQELGLFGTDDAAEVQKVRRDKWRQTMRLGLRQLSPPLWLRTDKKGQKTTITRPHTNEELKVVHLRRVQGAGRFVATRAMRNGNDVTSLDRNMQKQLLMTVLDNYDKLTVKYDQLQQKHTELITSLKKTFDTAAKDGRLPPVPAQLKKKLSAKVAS